MASARAMDLARETAMGSEMGVVEVG